MKDIFKLLALLITTIMGYCHASSDTERILQEANKSYLAGEKAQTIAARKDAFNKALALYGQLEEKHNPVFGNGKLFFNIANSYYQVERYPWAILYYYRALQLMPRDDKVRRNLNIALQKIDLPPVSEPPVSHYLLFFHYFLSLPERLQLFFTLSVFLLALISAFIIRKEKFIVHLLVIIGIFWLVMLLDLGYTRYLAPVEGVVVRSTMLYRDAGEQYAKVPEPPVVSGNKVQVLEVVQNGEWLKILAPSGTVGFVPNTALRLI